MIRSISGTDGKTAMLEKLIGNSFMPVAGLRDIRKGDVFRTVDGSRQGPLQVADSDATQMPPPTQPEQLVWYVHATPMERSSV